MFWLSISRRGLDFDDIAVEGIFRVADPKLCFYSYWCVSRLALNGCVRDKGQGVLLPEECVASKAKIRTDVYSRLFKVDMLKEEKAQRI